MKNIVINPFTFRPEYTSYLGVILVIPTRNILIFSYFNFVLYIIHVHAKAFHP